MAIPDHSFVVRTLYDTGLFNLRTHDGQAAFTDAVVSTLHGLDPNWRHLKKSAAQTHVHRHGEDSAVYLLPDDKAQAVDFIGGAGGANPQPGWIVDPEARYKHADAHDPGDHGLDRSAPPPAPAPQIERPPRDLVGRFFRELDAFYRDRGRGNRVDGGGSLHVDNEGIFVWVGEFIANYMEATGNADARYLTARNKAIASLEREWPR